MKNFFTDVSDRLFYFQNLSMDSIIKLRENDFLENSKYPEAPSCLEEAKEIHFQILELAGKIAAEELEPLARKVDEEGVRLENGSIKLVENTQKALKILKEAGLFCISIPRSYSGMNQPHLIGSIILEMVSQADASLATIYMLQETATTILKFGSEQQKSTYIPQFCAGEVTGAMVLTEPEAGSDLQAVKTKAWMDEKSGQWYLNGTKRFITNGGADVQLVLARSEKDTTGGKGLSMFLYKKDENLKVRRLEDKMGLHGSPTAELFYDDAPCELVGKRKYGLIKYVFQLMNSARLDVALQAIGIAQAAYDKAVSYATERKQFDKPIIEFPAVYDLLANAKMDIESSRSLTYRTAILMDEADLLEGFSETQEHPIPEGSAERLCQLKKWVSLLNPLSKYAATEMANRVCHDSMQVFGGSGYMKDFDMERHYRDARITSIYEGTSQMQVIAVMSGIVKGAMSEMFEEFQSKARSESELSDKYEILGSMAARFNEAVTQIRAAEKELFDYLSRTVCDIGLLILTGYHYLEEAPLSEQKRKMTEKYFSERVPLFEAYYNKLNQANYAAVENCRDILGLKGR